MPLPHWSNSSGDDLERQFRDVRRRWIPAAGGTLRFENETWSLEVFGCGWCHPSPLDSRFRGNDEVGGGDDGKHPSRVGVREMPSYQ